MTAFVDLADRDAWLLEAGEFNLGAGLQYMLGDANLDGNVDVTDFNTWNANKFTQVAAWSRGEFNGDGLVDTTDFNLWNANKFRSSAIAAGAAAMRDDRSSRKLKNDVQEHVCRRPVFYDEWATAEPIGVRWGMDPSQRM